MPVVGCARVGAIQDQSINCRANTGKAQEEYLIREVELLKSLDVSLRPDMCGSDAHRVAIPAGNAGTYRR